MMKDRRGFQVYDGFGLTTGKPVRPRATPARRIPQDANEPLSCVHREQIGSHLTSALKVSEQRLSALLHDRSRIGRELHDSVLQALYAIAVNISQSSDLRRDAPPPLPSSRGDATDQLKKLIQDIRRMILSVESDNIDPFRLLCELQSLAQACERVSGVRIRVAVAPAAEEILTGEEARELLAIARETLSNCVRHAHATQIVIALRHIGSRVRLRICDNGSGFEVAEGQTKGLGFAQMEVRVRKIGGRLSIQSTVGRGTCVTADVYLEPVLTTI